MIFDGMEKHPGARFLFMMACGVIVVYGLHFAAPILLPFSMALFLAVLSLPIMIWLQRNGVPAPLAIAIAVLVDVAVFGLLVLLASQSASELQAFLPRYAARFTTVQTQWIEGIRERFGVDLSPYVLTEVMDPQAVVNMIGGLLGRAASFLSSTFLVFLIMIFILAEATVFPTKFKAIAGGDGGGRRMIKIIAEIQEYLGIKTVISLLTGLLLGLWCYIIELDFPILLGMVAFVLNYVPTVGSIIAAFPAVLLSFILHGTVGHAVLTAVGYIVVNTIFGNIIEPNVMSRRLGLSTLVVILSLIFWGWTWGPVGALLAVPLTMVVKIWLEHTHDLRWVAVLLDKAPPPVTVPGPANVDLDPGV